MTALRISQKRFVEMLECRWIECDELISDRPSFVRHMEFQRFLEIKRQTRFCECKMDGGDSLNSSQRSTALHVAAVPDAHPKLGCSVAWKAAAERHSSHLAPHFACSCSASLSVAQHNARTEACTDLGSLHRDALMLILDRSTHSLRRRSPDNQIFLGIFCNSVLWRPRSPHSAANVNLKPSSPPACIPSHM